jgi:cell wall-associated NlpC family hydrolase
MDVGLGPEAYDCSGLVIAAIASAAMEDIQSWKPGVRHARQFAQVAESKQSLENGDVLVFGRHYTLGEQAQYVPGHMGIAVLASATEIMYVHALAKQGKVIRSTLTEEKSKQLLMVIDPQQIAKYCI